MSERDEKPRLLQKLPDELIIRMSKFLPANDLLYFICTHKRAADLLDFELAQLALTHQRSGDHPKYALQWAIMKHENEIVERLLRSGAEVDVADDLGFSALHYAAEVGNVQAGELLVQHGANIEAESAPRAYILGRPFHIATYNKQYDFIQFLVDHGADLHAEAQGQTALAWAVIQGDIELAEFLIHRGADIHEEPAVPRTLRAGETHPAGRWTLIHNAVYGDDPELAVEMVRLLVKEGADLSASAQDWIKGTALHLAVRIAPLVAVELLKMGIDIEVKDESEKVAIDIAVQTDRDLMKTELGQQFFQRAADASQTPHSATALLVYAVRENNEELVTRLLESGARADVTRNGIPLIGRADSRGIIRRLVDVGADINATDFNGQTILHRNLYYSPESSDSTPIHLRLIVSEAIKRGADVNLPDKNDRTPLDILASIKHDDTLEFQQERLWYWDYAEILVILLLNGADPNRKRESTGRTPLHSLISTLSTVREANFGHIGLMIRNGADANAQDVSGNTPLHSVFFHPYRDREENFWTIILEQFSCSNINLNIPNKSGYSVVSLAVRFTPLEKVWAVLSVMKSFGASLQEENPETWATLLHELMTKFCHGDESWSKTYEELVELLLDEGVSINAKSYGGETALECALAGIESDTVRKLEDKEVKRIIKFFVAHGASIDKGSAMWGSLSTELRKFILKQWIKEEGGGDGDENEEGQEEDEMEYNEEEEWNEEEGEQGEWEQEEE